MFISSASELNEESSSRHKPALAGSEPRRYALFLRDEDGNPVLLQKGVNNHEDRWSEHGLGHLRNPSKFESEDRDWIPQAWSNIVRRALSLPTQPLSFEHLPAIGRVTITSPKKMRSLAKLNLGKKY